MGRREAVVKESSEALGAERIRCLGVQVSKGWRSLPLSLYQVLPQSPPCRSRAMVQHAAGSRSNATPL